jgi:hypothetical protein
LIVPRYWSSRQFGGDAKMEGLNSMWDMAAGLLF